MIAHIFLTLSHLQGQQLRTAWDLAIGPSSGEYCYLSSDDKNVYALSSTGRMKGFRIEDGRPTMDLSLGSKAEGLLTVPGRGSFALIDSHLVKLNANMTPVWRAAPRCESNGRSAIAVGPDGTVAVETIFGVQIYSADGIGDGKSLVSGAGSFVAPVFLDQDTVCSLQGNLISISVTKPTSAKWTIKTGQTGSGAGLVLDRGMLYACPQERIIKIDPFKGKIIWDAEVSGGYTPAICDQAVVVPTSNGIGGFDARNGSVGWANQLRAYSGALDSGNRTAVVMTARSTDLSITLLDAYTGSVLSQTPPLAYAQALFEAPFIKASKNMFAGYYGGKLFCVKVE